MRSKFRTTFAMAAAAAMVLGTAGLAAADDVNTTSESPTYSVVSGVKTFIMEVGDTASAMLTYSETNTDGVSGCNLGGRDSAVTLGVTQTAAPTGGAGISGLPQSVTLTDCNDTETLTFSAVSPGTTTVTFPVSAVVSNKTGAEPGTFNTSGATFVVTVLAPEEDEGRDAPAIANEYLKGLSSTRLTACKENNGTNKNQSNWHGQLISKVAQHFEGQSFGPSREYIVTDFVDGQC
jgi:hypothetical protein